MPADLLEELVFKSNQPPEQQDTCILPILSMKGLVHALSLGPGSRNMAEGFNFDATDLFKRQSEFLLKNGFNSFDSAYISFVPQENEPSIVSLTKPNLSGHPLPIPAEAMFTQLTNIPLIHKPADCPTIIIHGIDGEGKAVLGLVHLGRPQINNRITEKSLEYLEKYYYTDLASLTIGISPSIGPKYYFIKQRDQEQKNLIDIDYWGKYASTDEVSGEEVIRIDVLGKILSILSDFGVPENKVQAYGHNDAVDTYFLAATIPPQAFSHRFAISTNQPEKNGRIMVACQL